MTRKKARPADPPTPSESPVVSDDDGIDTNYNEKLTIADDVNAPAVEHLPDSLLDDDAGIESDSSSEGDTNPVGDIPMRWYDGFDHIGYNQEGEKVIRSNKPSALDLAADPHAWRKIYDEKNDTVLELSHDELKTVARMRAGRFPSRRDDSIDEVVAWSGPVMQHAVVDGNEPKRRFLPSRHEARLVVRLVRAIRDGKIRPPSQERNDDDADGYTYDVWAGHEPKTRENMTKSERMRDTMRIPAPKPPLPTNSESYNPPSEYLPNRQEIRRWKRLEPEDRASKFLPERYGALRHVPAYPNFIRERFDRCLDLYLAVRIMRDQSKVAAEDLVPDLPTPSELRPFPTDIVSTIGPMTSRARVMDLHAGGNLLLCGCDDGCVRLFEAATGYLRATWDLGKRVERIDDLIPPVNAVAWCPRERAYVFAAAVGRCVILVSAARVLGINDEETRSVMERNESAGEVDVKTSTNMRDAGIEWEYCNMQENGLDENSNDAPFVGDKQEEDDCAMIVIRHSRLQRTLSWHRKGDYIACVGRDGNSGTVVVHRMSHRLSQTPFKKASLVQAVKFHPTRPFFLVATMHNVRVFNLSLQEMVKTLKPGVSWISSIDIHPSGDHVLVTSYDRRVCWFDLDMSTRPFKTVRNHEKAVRVAKYHPRLPLFADASDDGFVHVFHGMVYDDLAKNALIVPLRKLKVCSKIVDSLGVLDIVWHPRLPWLFTCAADGSVHLLVDCSQG